MAVRQTLAVAVAGFHLLLVAFGAAQIDPFPRDGSGARILGCYRSLSGADSTYSFFAPNVPSRIQAEIILTSKDGNHWSQATTLQGNREVQLRQHATSGYLVRRKSRDELTAAWAKTLLERHRHADQVVVRVVADVVPPLDEYRAGARFDRITLYETAFKRASHTSIQAEE